LQPAAKLLELGLTPSDSEQFLTPPIANGYFPKGSNGAHQKPTTDFFFYTGGSVSRMMNRNSYLRKSNRLDVSVGYICGLDVGFVNRSKAAG